VSQFSHYEACPKCRERGHDSRGDNLAVYRDGSVHCFACGYHKYSILNYWKNRHVKEDHVPKSVRPADWTREVPSRAWEWLLQYGLPWSYWNPHCGYSPDHERLVFTVGSPAAFSIGRYIGPAQGGGAAGVPVGIRPEARHLDHVQGDRQPAVGARDRPNKKWFVWGDSHKHAEVIGRGRSGYVVLVEDVVSGHKVGQVAETIPLFGTSVYNPHFYYLINENKPVVLWLDKDQQQNVKKQALQLESVLNQPVKVIITDKDPKAYSEEQINAILVESGVSST
jgi:Zn ribbon nucleic-acid-binding protein